jgi:hypothetical protein
MRRPSFLDSGRIAGIVGVRITGSLVMKVERD